MQKNSCEEQGPGAPGFLKSYWHENYAKPQTMDGIYNARLHAEALKALFELEFIDVGSIVDFGFGLGHLFKEMIDIFNPHTVIGIEPSSYPYAFVRQQSLTNIDSTQILLLKTDLLSWCEDPYPLYQGPFDLGICTSVFQYLSEWELTQVVPILAKRVRYLYFTVPIDIELDYQEQELDFHDRYAIKRSKEAYLQLLTPHFTIVSTRVLESKVHFDEETTSFMDLLYRF